MIEKQKLLVEFDLEKGFDFMRFCFRERKPESKMYLERAFSQIKDNASFSCLANLQAALQMPNADTNDYLLGMLGGIALAVSISRPNEEGSVCGFLENVCRRPDNVADIADAFRKRAES